MTAPTPAATAKLLEEFLRRLFTGGQTQAMHRLSDLDLSFTQVRLLMLLGHQEDGGLPIHELAERLGLSVASAGRNVEQLVTAGLVQRQEDSHDRRVRRVALSPQGADVIAGHLDCHRETMTRLTKRLDAADRTRLAAALEPILAGDALLGEEPGRTS